MSQYEFLPLSTIREWILFMGTCYVSEVARSARGFLHAYQSACGDSRRLSPEWHAKRDGFIAQHMAQVIANNEDLFGDDGWPTRRHLALIAWAYSPQPKEA
jgi:hypothetical protein